MSRYFQQNKYKSWYISIIKNAKTRKWTRKTAPCYTESHHIIPKSFQKNEHKVLLTAREHFICHILLPKMCVNKKHKKQMNWALHRMTFSTKSNRRLFSHEYELARKIHSNFISEENHKKKGKTTSLKGKPKSKEIRNRLQKTMLAKYQNGYISPTLGRKRPQHEKDHMRNIQLGVSYVEKFGIKRAIEIKKKIGLAAKRVLTGQPKQKFLCKHCNQLIGGKSNLLRWHDDNCKSIQLFC